MRGGAVGLVACNEFLVVMLSFAFTLVSNVKRVGRCWMGYGCGAGLLYHAGQHERLRWWPAQGKAMFR
jgi:hypothetical protein